MDTEEEDEYEKNYERDYDGQELENKPENEPDEEQEEFVERFKKLKTYREEDGNNEEDVYELSTEEVPDTLGLELMEYELEELTEEKNREYHYRSALENLYEGDFNAFLDDEIIKEEFPRIDDDVKINCGNESRLINFYPAYISLWEGNLYWEKLEGKNRNQVVLYTYAKDFDSKGNAIKSKNIYNVVSIECFQAFRILVDLVNVTKYMAVKLHNLQQKQFSFTYDFYKEIMEPIVKALGKVYDKFLEH